jgi:hypothetical protein
MASGSKMPAPHERINRLGQLHALFDPDELATHCRPAIAFADGNLRTLKELRPINGPRKVLRLARQTACEPWGGLSAIAGLALGAPGSFDTLLIWRHGRAAASSNPQSEIRNPKCP